MILNYGSVRTSHPTDCGLCVLSGITGISKQDLVDKYKARWEGMAYSDMMEVCYRLFAFDYLSWIDNELPKETKYSKAEYYPFGKPSWENFLSWGDRLKEKIKAGCVGIAQVHASGSAMGDRKHQFSLNHWVLIKGFEDIDGTFDDDGNLLTPYDRSVYVSCNSRGTYKVDWLEFLMNYGGYNTIYVKPKTSH